MNTLLLIFAVASVINLCIGKRKKSRVEIISTYVSLGCVFSFFIFQDVTGTIEKRRAARIEREIISNQSLHWSFDEAVKIVRLIGSEQSPHEIVDSLRNKTLYLYNRLSRQIDGSIHLIRNDYPKEIITKMREKNALLKAAEDSIIACDLQADSAQVVTRLGAYEKAVKVCAELLAQRIHHENAFLEVMNVLLQDTITGEFVMYSETNSPRYSGFDISDADLK